MGKLKRDRTKYHFTCNEKKREIDTRTNEGEDDTGLLRFNLTLPEDIFKNVDINMDNVSTDIENINQTVTEVDSKSVRSVKSLSKSIKSFKQSLGGIHLKKNDKRTLRRNLFLKKLEVAYVNSKINKNKKNKGASLSSISEMDEHLPRVNMLFHKPNKSCLKQKIEPVTPKLKQKGILKAKDRKKALLNNLNSFKKLLSDSKLKSNPLDLVTSCLEEKVFNDKL